MRNAKQFVEVDMRAAGKLAHWVLYAAPSGDISGSN
jgi:hypothetical protein